jgi:hypothetical protein
MPQQQEVTTVPVVSTDTASPSLSTRPQQEQLATAPSSHHGRRRRRRREPRFYGSPHIGVPLNTPTRRQRMHRSEAILASDPHPHHRAWIEELIGSADEYVLEEHELNHPYARILNRRYVIVAQMRAFVREADIIFNRGDHKSQ